MATSARRVVEGLASPRWMLAFFVFAGIGGLLSISQPEWITPIWIVPLGVFAIALLASVVTRPRFRRDPALLGLHLALLCMVVLFAVARLTYLDGAVSLTEGGEPFDGRLDVDRHGPLHPQSLARLRFANEGTIEDFRSGERWYGTTNRVRWWRADGFSGTAEIANDRPLVLDGYRIHPTFNRGYSALFRWEAAQAEPIVGGVQLRADQEFGMANEWPLPTGVRLWIMLDPLENAKVRLQPGERREGLGAATLPHRLVVRYADTRRSLNPGESLQFGEGRLVYLGLRSWMGYRIIYDPAANWLAAAAALTVLCMIGYYWRELRSGWTFEEAAAT